VGAVIEIMTGIAKAAGAYFKTSVRREIDGVFDARSTR
jgi:hypothetical protein